MGDILVVLCSIVGHAVLFPWPFLNYPSPICKLTQAVNALKRPGQKRPGRRGPPRRKWPNFLVRLTRKLVWKWDINSDSVSVWHIPWLFFTQVILTHKWVRPRRDHCRQVTTGPGCFISEMTKRNVHFVPVLVRKPRCSPSSDSSGGASSAIVVIVVLFAGWNMLNKYSLYQSPYRRSQYVQRLQAEMLFVTHSISLSGNAFCHCTPCVINVHKY